MNNVLSQGGIAFVLLHFARLNETYLLPSSCLITFYYEKNGLKSIPLSYIRENGYKIETNHIPRIPYLEIVNKLCEVQ
jgi:recombination protein U